MSITVARAAIVAACLAAAAGLTTGTPARAQAIAQSESAVTPMVPPGSSDEDPAVTERAKDVLHRVQTRTVDRTQLADDFNSRLDDVTLARAATQLAPLGDVQRISYNGKLTNGKMSVYIYHVRLIHGRLQELIAIDASNKIIRLFFRVEENDSPPAVTDDGASQTI